MWRNRKLKKISKLISMKKHSPFKEIINSRKTFVCFFGIFLRSANTTQVIKRWRNTWMWKVCGEVERSTRWYEYIYWYNTSLHWLLLAGLWWKHISRLIHSDLSASWDLTVPSKVDNVSCPRKQRSGMNVNVWLLSVAVTIYKCRAFCFHLIH